MIQDTSIKSWFEKLESVGPDEQAVLLEVRKEPATIRELAVRLGWEAGRVSARINALQEPTPAERDTHKRKLGLVRIARTPAGQLMKAKCRITGKRAYVWETTDPLPPARKVDPKKAQMLFQ